MRKYAILIFTIFCAISCKKNNCPAGYYGVECEDKILETFKGKYCGTLTENGVLSEYCFLITETSDISIFDIDVNIKGRFTGEKTNFEILEKDVSPAKIIGGSGQFTDNNLSFTIYYKVFGVKTSSVFEGVKQ